MFEAHYATREDIDAAMRLGCGLPMGPLALMDLIGLDTAYEILDTMYRRGGRDRRHAPVPLLKQMVTAGLLGRKTGRGFYTYEQAGLAGRGRRRADPGRGRRGRPRRAPIAHGRRRRLRHHGHRHHRGLRQGRVRGAQRDPRRGEVGAGLRGRQDLAQQGRGARQADRGRPRRRARPDHLVAPTSTTSPTSTSWSRRWSRS